MEYLLLAVVVILIGKVILSPMGEKLGEWSSAFIGPGGYYSCLMEYGLIPGKKWQSMGLGCTTKKPGSIGSLSQGGGLTGGDSFSSGTGEGQAGGEGGSSAGAENKNSSQSGDQKKGKSAKGKKGRKKGGESSSGSSQTADSSTGGSDTSADGNGFKFPKKKKSRVSGSKKKWKKRKRGKKPSLMKDEKLKVANQSGDGDGDEGLGVGYLGQLSFSEDEEEQTPPVFRATAGADGKEQAERQSKQKNRLKMEPPKQKKTGDIGDLEPISFAGYLKWLFIAVLLIAVILVIGSQILEIQNAE